MTSSFLSYASSAANRFYTLFQFWLSPFPTSSLRRWKSIVIFAILFFCAFPSKLSPLEFLMLLYAIQFHRILLCSSDLRLLRNGPFLIRLWHTPCCASSSQDTFTSCSTTFPCGKRPFMIYLSRVARSIFWIFYLINVYFPHIKNHCISLQNHFWHIMYILRKQKHEAQIGWLSVKGVRSVRNKPTDEHRVLSATLRFIDHHCGYKVNSVCFCRTNFIILS